MDEGLERFVVAQGPVWAQVRAELEAGAKRSHWMWFVFPQVAGLGTSPTAVRFGIAGLAEARAYLRHRVLGARLREATELMLGHAGQPADAILGGIDAMKFRSSMTLFHAASAPEGALFGRALEAFCGGVPDERTLAVIG